MQLYCKRSFSHVFVLFVFFFVVFSFPLEKIKNCYIIRGPDILGLAEPLSRHNDKTTQTLKYIPLQDKRICKLVTVSNRMWEIIQEDVTWAKQWGGDDNKKWRKNFSKIDTFTGAHAHVKHLMPVRVQIH